MAKCQWEEDECYRAAEGGEFFCLTHLEENRHKEKLEEKEVYYERLDGK